MSMPKSWEADALPSRAQQCGTLPQPPAHMCCHRASHPSNLWLTAQGTLSVMARFRFHSQRLGSSTHAHLDDLPSCLGSPLALPVVQALRFSIRCSASVAGYGGRSGKTRTVFSTARMLRMRSVSDSPHYRVLFGSPFPWQITSSANALVSTSLLVFQQL